MAESFLKKNQVPWLFPHGGSASGKETDKCFVTIQIPSFSFSQSFLGDVSFIVSQELLLAPSKKLERSSHCC